ncbi:MAG TPA: hypothetical protein VII69_14370 [Candidatus Eremiobacteraceae bacterium]
MNRCTALSEELTDVGLGRRASEALTSHLADCPSCAAELERRRALALRMDAAVSGLVGSQPPAWLIESIAARARSAQPPRVLNGTWPDTAVVSALAASVIAVIIGLRAMLPTAMQHDSAALSAWRSPTAALMEPRGSVLSAPLHDFWFDVEPSPSRSKPTPGESHAT